MKKMRKCEQAKNDNFTESLTFLHTFNQCDVQVTNKI